MGNVKNELIHKAKWIGTDLVAECPVFVRDFSVNQAKKISKAVLAITAIGVYEAHINNIRVGDFILAPGLTSYGKRLQYQSYDVTNLIQEQNEISITLGSGWYRGRISNNWGEIHNTPAAVRAGLQIIYEDESIEEILTDESYKTKKSKIQFSDIYDGEIFDATFEDSQLYPVKAQPDIEGQEIIAQENEYIKEHEHIKVKEVIHTPKGETVLDFGQNMAGYVCFKINAKENDRIVMTHIEVLDAAGNVYHDNYRSAKTEITYICKEGEQSYKPHFTFMGFRYIAFKELPDYITDEELKNGFEVIALYTDMKRTGHITTGNALLNRLYENTLWSQRSNFIDIPTDCPQRDERMGWTGDAQVFSRTAAYNYQVEKFFTKWCRDLRTEQRDNGSIPDTVPNFWRLPGSSAAWGDVICVIPWQMYLAYGNITFLTENFEAMTKWVDYITNDTSTPNLWTTSEEQKTQGQKHYGDWLALDAPEGSYKGSTRDDFIASAFYLYSTQLVIKAGHVLGKDVSKYEALEKSIIDTFNQYFKEYTTQTEHVLALYMGISNEPEKTAAALATDIKNNGCKMKTGFVGTPYLLHVLSQYGYYDICYSLLLQEEFPSWLFSVKQGATSIWEHWDGKKLDGSFWSTDMNSFNHYAYGSVFDWVYSVAAGITPLSEAPGYEKVSVHPHPDKRLGFLEVSLETKYGTIQSDWYYEGNTIRYKITTPVEASCQIGDKKMTLLPGEYVFYSE